MLHVVGCFTLLSQVKGFAPFSRGKNQHMDKHLFPSLQDIKLEGSSRTWLQIFGAKRPELLATGFQWTEGPLWRPPHWFLFSDTIDGELWRFRPPPQEWKLEKMLENSGGKGCSRRKAAEPGSNGLAAHPTKDQVIFMAQHCARRVVTLDLDTHKIKAFASKGPGGKRLNSPNDLVVNPKGTHVYFTDPPYGLLEMDAFEDTPFLDAQSEIGIKGIYRAPVDGAPDEEAELLDASFSRPNGLAFSADGQHLYVAECCQGSHNATCLQGMHRYVRFNVDEDGKLSQRSQIEVDLSKEKAGDLGCADGFKVDHETGLLISSCAGGVCLIDFNSDSPLVARLVLGFRISNIGFSDEHAYLTGQQAIWRIPWKHDPADKEEL